MERETETKRARHMYISKKLNMGLLTLTCQMARRQEAAGVGGGAIGGWSWVAGAYRSRNICYFH